MMELRLITLTDNYDEVYQRLRTYMDNGFNFNDGNEMLNLVAIVAQVFSKIKDNYDTIELAHIIDEAVGLQLDNIGDDIEQPRYNNDDDDYKFMLKTKIIAANSNGTINDIIQIVCNSLGISPSTSGIVVKNDYAWNGNSVTGNPYVIDVQSIPTSIITSSDSLKILMDRIGSATIAGVTIKSVQFINGSNSTIFDGVGIYEDKSSTILVTGGN